MPDQQPPWPAHGQQQPYGQPGLPAQPPGQQPYQPPGREPYGPPAYQQGPPQPHGQQPRRQRPWYRRHKILTAAGSAVVLVTIGSVLNAGHNPPPLAAPAAAESSVPAASAATSAAAPAQSHPAAPAPAKAHTVATFTGSGIRNTPRFTVTDTWKLTYRFSCASFGQSGNFQVFEDGGSDFNGVTVNELAMTKAASTWAYGDAGRHYLEVNSECDWTVKVIDEP